MSREQSIADVMSTDILALTGETPIEEAVRALAERGVSGAPVVDGEGRYAGLLDDTDLLVSEARLHAPTTIEILGAYIPLPGERHRWSEEVRQALGRVVADVMDPDSPTLGIDATVEDAATLIVDHEVSRVTVLDADRRPVGIVTRGDLVKSLYRAS